MLKKFLNEVVIKLSISPDGPVLIKSGAVGLSTDMCFVKIRRNGEQEVYLPGTSLKGVLRSHCEKICRTLQEHSVCEPFNIGDTEITQEKEPYISCSQIFSKVKHWKEGEGKYSYARYHASCPACRLFGSLNFKGRCFIDDAYVEGNPPKPHIRDGVGIDRFTGAAKGGAKYDFEVITEGKFTTYLYLRNFEMWQLALLHFALQDLVNGEIRIGMATSRGLGKIACEVLEVKYHQWGRRPENLAISDITALEKQQEQKDLYGFDSPSKAQVDLNNLEGKSWQSAGIRHTLALAPSEFFSQVGENISDTLSNYLDKNPAREKIKEHYYSPSQ